MKKLIIRIGLVLVGLLLIGLVVVFFSLNSIVKKGVETVGPEVTKVNTTLDAASISPFSGSGGLKKLHFGNPAGYKTSSSIDVGEARLALKVGSLLGDKIIIKEIFVDQPIITFEGTLKGKNNLSDILKNVEEFTATEEKSTSSSKKLQVDSFVLQGAKIRVSMDFMRGRTVDLPMPAMTLKDLGTGPEGITVGALSKKLITSILENVTSVVSGSMGELTKEVTGAVKEVGKEATDTINKTAEGVKGIFKRDK